MNSSSLIDIPILNSIDNQCCDSKKINKLLKDYIKDIHQVIEPFTTLRAKQSQKKLKFIDFNLGSYLYIKNQKLFIRTYGLEKIFVIPSTNQLTFPYFGSFKIFYYLISIISTEVPFEENELFEFNQAFQKFQKQNEILNQYWIKLDQVFLCQKEVDKENMKQFILNLKSLIPNNYIQILLESFNVISAIIRLTFLSEFSEKDFSNSINNLADILSSLIAGKQNQGEQFSQIFEESTDCSEIINEEEEDEIFKNKIDSSIVKVIIGQEEKQKFLKQIFQDQLGISSQDNKIEKLFENYQYNVSALFLNTNRIQGFAQYIYEQLIKSICFEIEQVFSEKIQQQIKTLNNEILGIFFKLPDPLFGGNVAKPHISNFYFVNLYRDLILCMYKNQENKNDAIVEQMENLEKRAVKLAKLNDLESIRNFFRTDQIQQKSNNFIVQINHKYEDDKSINKTIYQFNEFCKVNKFDISQSDKQILQNSKLQLFQKHIQFSPQPVFLLIKALFNTFKDFQEIGKNTILYKIDTNFIDPINAFTQNQQNQEFQEPIEIIIQNKLYSNQYSNYSNEKINYEKRNDSNKQSSFSQEVEYLYMEAQPVNQLA